MKKFYIYLFIASLAVTVGCTGNKKQQDGQSAELSKATDSLGIVQPKYAKGFHVEYPGNGIRLVEVKDPQKGKGITYRFALVNRGASDEIPDGYTKIEVPVRSVVLMTKLYCP